MVYRLHNIEYKFWEVLYDSKLDASRALMCDGRLDPQAKIPLVIKLSREDG